jgi:hypothetical protein
MKYSIFGMVFAALLVMPMLAKASPATQLIDHIRANDAYLQDKSQANGLTYHSVGYLQGLVTGVQSMGMGDFFCTPENGITSQHIAVVSKWVKANPEKWNEPDAFLVAFALSEAFPCEE